MQFILDSIVDILNNSFYIKESKPHVLAENYIRDRRLISVFLDRRPLCQKCASLSKISKYTYFRTDVLTFQSYICCRICGSLLNIILTDINSSLGYFNSYGFDISNIIDVHHMLKVTKYLYSINKQDIFDEYLAQILKFVVPSFPTSFII